MDSRKSPNRFVDLQEKERQRRLVARWFFFFFFLAALAGGGYALFIKSDTFRFSELRIEGEERYSRAEIRSYLETKIPAGEVEKKILGFNHFWSWPRALGRDDLQGLLGVKSVNFISDYSRHILTAEIAERKPAGIWCARKTAEPSCVWFDREGVAIQDSMFVEGYLITVVNDYSRESIRLGDYVVPENEVGNLFAIFGVIQKNGIGGAELRISEIDSHELQVLGDAGPHLYFNLRFPTAYAGEVLEELAKKPEYKKMQYVDFRIEGMVYYK